MDKTSKRKRYTLNQVTHNRFYQMPVFLFNDEFIKLSSDAKILYTLLKDRHELSVSNNWVNENNEVYLIFSRENMQEMLGCSAPTLRKALNQLKEFNLITEERQGLNKPNLIYLMDVNVDIPRSERFFQSGVKDSFSPECKNFSPNNTNNNKTKEEEEERIENASFSDENKEEFQELNLEILDQYQKNISSKLSNKELETLLILQEQVGIELVVKAIEIACQNNGKTIGYIQTILEDWSSKGLKTPDEVDKYLNKWKEKNQKARENREKAVELRAKKTPVVKTNQYSNRDNVPQMRNYQERKYDEDFFKNLYRRTEQGE